MEKTQYYERYHKLAKDIVESLPNPNTESPKKNNIARIYFRDVPGTNYFEVTDIENFKTAREISNVYGLGVREAYSRQPHRMYKSRDEVSVCLQNILLKVGKGDRYEKKFFLETLIPEARKCGKALSRIIKEYRESPIQCIEI